MTKDVPLRKELEKSGYTVEWLGEGQPIRVKKGADVWSISPDEYELRGDRAYVSPTTLANITGAVPLRSGLQELGYKVSWFGEGQPIEVSKGGVTRQVPPSDYSLYGNTAYVPKSVFASLTGLQPAQQHFESKGYEVGFDPASRRVSVTHPVTGETQYFKPDTIESGASFARPELLQTIENRLTPGYEKYYAEQLDALNQFVSQLQSGVQQYLNTMNNYIKQYSDAALAAYAQYQREYQQALDRLNALSQQRADIPDSVKVAIKVLRDQYAEDAKALDEEMNRRGIYQSGYAMEQRRKLQEKYGTEEEKLLAQWAAQQNRQMFEAAMEAAKMYERYAGGLSQMHRQAYMQPLQLAMSQAQEAYKLGTNVLSKAYDLAAQLRQYRYEQEEAARRARRAQQAAAAKQEAELLKILTEYDWRTQQQASQDAYRWAALQSLDEYRRAIADLKQQELYARGNPPVENQAIADILGTCNTFEDAMEYIKQNKNYLAKSRARISEILKALSQRWPVAIRLLDELGGYGYDEGEEGEEQPWP